MVRPLPPIHTALALALTSFAAAAPASASAPAAASAPAPASASASAPAAAPAPASAAAPPGKHCADEPLSKALLRHTLGVQMNPLGIEHQLQLSLCEPLIRKPGVLYSLTSFEIGLANYLSPTYVHQGGFVTLTPLSVLQLRAELTGVSMWAAPIDGAGYHAFPSYDADFRQEARPKERGQQAGGFAFAGSATLRGRIGPESGVALLATNTLLTEYWSLGDGPYYYNFRRDILLASSDWVVKNTAAVLVEIPLSTNVVTRLGATDDTTVAPGSGHTSNIVAGLATLLVRRVGGTVRDLQPFLRVGAFTHHASSAGFRTGEINILLGANAVYELAVLDD